MIATATDPRIKTLVGLCGMAGLRISEALLLPPGNVDFQQRGLLIRGKGDKERWVPMGDKLFDMMVEAVARAFGQPYVVQIEDRLARRTITRLGARAGLKRSVASHQLRATYATHLLQEGVDIRTIQELLGHASVTTTQGYTAVTTERMRAAVAGL